MTDKPKLTLSNSKKIRLQGESINTLLSTVATVESKQVEHKAAKYNKPHLSNKSQLSTEDYGLILQYLRTHYPKCFPSDPLPLAVGIHRLIFAIPDLPFSRMQIRKFLAEYTSARSYRQKLVAGDDRFTLAGTATAKILEEEVNRAKWQEIKSSSKAAATKVKHDALIKKAMENPTMAREFLAEHLPEEYKSLIDLSTIKPEKESYVEQSLKAKLSDMVFSVQMRIKSEEGTEHAFIYVLLEHLSYSDYWIAFRLLKYSLLLLERHTIKRDKLPVILPIVLYNGKKRYFAPRNIFDLFAYPDVARKAMTEDYTLIDLQAMPDDNIDYETHLSFLLYMMKHIHERDMIAMLKEAMTRCRKAIVLDRGQNYILTRLILWYTDSKVPIEKKQLLEQVIVDNLPKDEASNIMRTIADGYIEEGFNKGMIQGIEQGIEQRNIEIAKNLLAQKVDINTIAVAIGLSTQEIQKIKN